MLKILFIAFKDLTLAFRDRAALILMLAAPFALTLGLGLVTGRLSGNNSSGLSQIPVVIVNADAAQLGNTLVEVFQSADLAELIAPTVLTDEAAARQQVLEDEAAAAIIVPEGFTESLFNASGEAVKIEVHANPARPLSAGVVQSIVAEFISQVQAGAVTGQVAVKQLLSTGRLAPELAAAKAEELAHATADGSNTNGGLQLKRSLTAASPQEFDVLAFLAPGMALMFLMYTVSNGARSILAERAGGTLPRLLISPTSTAQVLGGKVFGIFLTGAAQVGILIVASAVLFGVRWGDWVGVVALVAACALGATGWGLLLAALAKNPAQVASVGSAVMLLFAILGGSFGNVVALPNWLTPIAQLTPNYWGIQGFGRLGNGGVLADVWLNVGALLVMGAVLFLLASLLFRRQNVLQR
ncbi:MAG: ABC transporter permease [Anaerolineales bacterium]|nr:ABC transporter permease [Anaerolineales bacterium]